MICETKESLAKCVEAGQEVIEMRANLLEQLAGEMARADDETMQSIKNTLEFLGGTRHAVNVPKSIAQALLVIKTKPAKETK